MVLVVENRRNAGCGRMTRFWSSSVNLPSTSSTRWMTNMTSGRPASYSSRSEEHTSELQSLMRISYAVFCLKKKKHNKTHIIFINTEQQTTPNHQKQTHY